MTDDPRVQQLLDELDDSGATPEAVCQGFPELLPTVRKRWRQMCRLRADLDALFPTPPKQADSSQSHRPDVATLPQLPGYEVESVLGRGGMGIVFRAKHLVLNRSVAIKTVLAGEYAGPRERARFQREAEAVAALRHPNVVQVYDVGDVDGRPYFTMEYVEGGSLAHRLGGAPQPPEQAAPLLATLAGAVQAAHAKGIVHRDLKPANVLLTSDGVPKISDFGLARRLEGDTGITGTGVAVGTPSYMAPEQALGRSDAHRPAVDVYALGAILYEVLTGRPPFRSATAAYTVQQVVSQEPVPPSRLNDKVPRELEAICLKCLEKDPDRRYGTAAEFSEDLVRFQRGEPILARRAGPVRRAVKWTRRHQSLAAAIVFGMLLLSVLVGVGGWTIFERTARKRIVTEDLDQVVVALRNQKWDEAHSALERAKGRLGDGGPSDLRQRAAQLEHQQALVGTLEDILLGSLDTDPLGTPIQPTAARYEEALREAGFVNGLENPEVVAARIRATEIAAPVLAALDNWASFDNSRHDWLLEVARLVDEDPGSRPIRDSRLWENRPALEEFAKSAPLENQSVPFLSFLGLELHRHGGDSVAYFKRVQQAHVNSHLANGTLAHALVLRGDPAESLRYFQAAIALRPTHAALHHNLGIALGGLGRWNDAIVEFEAARHLEPESAWYNTSIGLALNNSNQPAKAERQLRQVLETNPTYALALAGLADSLLLQGRHTESIDAFRRAVAADPKYSQDYRHLIDAYLTRGMWDEGRTVWQHWLSFNPPDHQAWDGYAELCLYLGNEVDYRRARAELLRRFGNATDPQVAERTGRACLFLSATDDELKQATALIDRALAAEEEKSSWLVPYLRFAKALAEYRAGRMKEAEELLHGDALRVLPPAPPLLLAMVQYKLGQTDAARKTFNAAVAGYNWDNAKVANRESWMNHLLRREAEALVKPNARESRASQVKPRD